MVAGGEGGHIQMKVNNYNIGVIGEKDSDLMRPFSITLHLLKKGLFLVNNQTA